MDKDSASIQSIERAVKILKAFSLDQPEWGVNEMGRLLNLHKSTVSRLMMTLERGGLLWRNPETQRYQLGIDLIGMASLVTSHLDVRAMARPFLRELAGRCQETVNLVVMDEGDVVNLEQFVPPARQVKNIGYVGRRMPVYCTAAGKVLLAYLPGHELEQKLPAELHCYTDHTISDLAVLRAELRQVRQIGYAVVQEELEIGLNAIAAPVFDHAGRVRYAASVAGPAYRVKPELFPELAGQVVATAAELSRQLGYRP